MPEPYRRPRLLELIIWRGMIRFGVQVTPWVALAIALIERQWVISLLLSIRFGSIFLTMPRKRYFQLAIQAPLLAVSFAASAWVPAVVSVGGEIVVILGCLMFHRHGGRMNWLGQPIDVSTRP